MDLEKAVLFPCPLVRRHDAADPTAWLRSLSDLDERFGDKPRIVLAHGTVLNFGSLPDDEETEAGADNLLDLPCLPEGAFDYIALGDWHGAKQVAAKAWYAGTPELARFVKGDDHNPGNVLAVKASRGQVPQVQCVPTGTMGWHELSFAFADDSGLARHKEQVDERIGSRANQDLLWLHLSGSLSIEASTQLDQAIEGWNARLLRVKLDNQATIAPSPAELDGLTQRAGDPLVACVAAKLGALASEETKLFSVVSLSVSFTRPSTLDNRPPVSTRILERIDVIQRTMTLAGSGAVEDYREMILGQVAEQIDASRLFAASQTGQQISESEVDDWIRGAVESVERWRKLFDSEVGMTGDSTRLKPTLTSDHFKAACRLAIENHPIRLRESRNSQNQFVPGVYNFDAPDAFRDPVFRPSRTMHVVFDREVFAAVRGQDLGTVRGQSIRPLLTGFGEPFTDWLFQTAMQARQAESAFSLRVSKDWPHGSGWLLVYAARWLSKARRLPTPDSLIPCFVNQSGEVHVLSASEGMLLVETAEECAKSATLPTPEAVTAARKSAQQVLRGIAARRDPSARAAANLSLLLAASVTQP